MPHTTNNLPRNLNWIWNSNPNRIQNLKMNQNTDSDSRSPDDSKMVHMHMSFTAELSSTFPSVKNFGQQNCHQKKLSPEKHSVRKMI